MSKRTGGFIGQDGINAPDPATGVSASGSDAQATVSFTSPSDVGGAAITSYRVQSNDGIGASGTSSPVTVTGLTNNTSYTFNVWAINPFGWSSPSNASGSFTPQASRGVFVGGNTSSGNTNVMQYMAIATTGNTTDFGDLSASVNGLATMASSTRGVMNGFGSTNMEYITIATTGNTTDFGDTLVVAGAGSGLANSTRGVYSVGSTGGTSLLRILGTVQTLVI